MDTGMHRLGFSHAQLPELIDFLREHPHIKVGSTFSHLAAAEDPREDEFTRSQLARFEALGWGPSNLEAQADEAVQANEALSAVGTQLAKSSTIPQGNYPNDYWSLATSLGDDVKNGNYSKASDEELMAVLQTFSDTCVSYAK